jgi:integrase
MILVKTNIYKRKERNGQITWMVRWKDADTGKWRALRGGRSKAEAVAFETRVREHLLRGEDPMWVFKPAVVRPTVREVADQFYKHTLFLSGTSEWQQETRSKIEKEIKPALGKLIFDELDSERIYRFYLQLKSGDGAEIQGRTHSTIQKYHITMSHLGAIYERMTGTRHNPVKDCTDFRKRFPFQPSSRSINFLTPEELEQLYAQARRSRNRLLYAFIKFLANTGLRRSEAVDLKWKDVDERSGFIHVRDSKNSRSRRVPLEAEAKAVLDLLPRRGEHVFVKHDGERYHSDSFLKPLKVAVERSGINKRIDVHTLRHSYGSNKIRMGWGLKKVSMILGHSSIEITSRVYTHLLDGDLKVSDDVRLDFDKKTESADIENGEETTQTMAHALAKALTDRLSAHPQGRDALTLIAEVLPSPASFEEILQDSSMTSKSGIHATPVLRNSKISSNSAQIAATTQKQFASDSSDLSVLSVADQLAQKENSRRSGTAATVC